jgi:hypothetical protein
LTYGFPYATYKLFVSKIDSSRRTDGGTNVIGSKIPKLCKDSIYFFIYKKERTMKEKKISQLSLEELKNTTARIDYEKPGVHAVGGVAVPGGCFDGNDNSGPDGCGPGKSNSGGDGCVDGESNTGAGGCENGSSNSGAPTP